MADEKKTYPAISVKNWFVLRRKFRSSIPTTVTPSLVAGWLGIGEESARANVIGALKQTGIIDKDGKPTERAKLWREDDQYLTLCDEIRREIYPQELLDLAPDATTGKETVQRWFAMTLGVGESAASKQAAFYLLLCEADPSKDADVSAKQSPQRVGAKSSSKSQPVSKGKTIPAKEPGLEDNNVADALLTPQNKLPSSLHIDIQIHIAPEASAEQIDQIFASMAKHLKNL
jgi:hypothetical protein